MCVDRISVTKVIENGISSLSFCLEDLTNGTNKKCTFQEGIIPFIKTDEWQFSLSHEKYEKFDTFLIPGVSCVINKDIFTKFKVEIKENNLEKEEESNIEKRKEENDHKDEQEAKEEVKENFSEILGNGINIGKEYVPFTNKRASRKGITGIHRKSGVIRGVDTNVFMSINFYLKDGLENFKGKEIVVKRNLYKAVVKATWVEKEKMFLFEPYAGNLTAFIFITYEDFTTAHDHENNLIDLNKIVGKYTRLVKSHKNIELVKEILRRESETEDRKNEVVKL